MDEPFRSLDPVLCAEMSPLVLRLRDHHGVTILYVTHDLSKAMRLADRVGVLYRGEAERFLERGQFQAWAPERLFQWYAEAVGSA